MPLRIGDSGVDKVFIGTDPVDKIYIGTELVWTGLAPDWVRYFPNVAVAQSIAPPSGGWPAVTIAVIWNSGLPDGDIFSPDTDGWFKIQQSGGRAYALASTGNNNPWTHNNNQPLQARNQVIVSRSATVASSVANGVSASVSSMSALNLVMKVRKADAQVRAVAMWNRALTPAEQTEALVQLNAAAP